MRLCCRIAALLACIATLSGARADDVTDQIDKALRAYQNHDTQTAIAALDAASSLMRQSRADVLKKLLPPPPPGWTADAAESSAVSVAMLGGGITASRAYHNGDQRVEVQLAADSPLLQGGVDRQPLAAVATLSATSVIAVVDLPRMREPRLGRLSQG